MDIAAAVAYARPGEQWMLVEYDYEGLQWLDSTEKPTIEELTLAWEKLNLETETKKAKREANLVSGIEKLRSLGLTVDEVKAVIGIE